MVYTHIGPYTIACSSHCAPGLAPGQPLAALHPVAHDHVLLRLQLQRLHHVVRDLPDPSKALFEGYQ